MVGSRSLDVVWTVPLSAWTAYTAYSQLVRRGGAKLRGARVTSFQEFREPHVHCLDAPFLKILQRAAVPGHAEHLGAGFFGSQLYFSQASGDLLEFDFPPLNDDVHVV